MCEAIRCDDDQHETIIHGNVIHRIGGMATGIAIKGINTITNNVIADPLVPATQRGLISLEVPPVTGSPIQRNIVVPSTADHNLYYNRANPQLARDFVQSMRAQGVERHSLVADPGFLDPEAGDYRLAPDSPARRLGIESIEISRAGLEPVWRQRLIGRQWSTRIEPAGGLIWQPVTVSIVANVADAAIHYTLDGSRPDRGSARYTGPFSVAPHTTVRAVAYAPGGRDVFGSEACGRTGPSPKGRRCAFCRGDVWSMCVSGNWRLCPLASGSASNSPPPATSPEPSASICALSLPMARCGYCPDSNRAAATNGPSASSWSPKGSSRRPSTWTTCSSRPILPSRQSITFGWLQLFSPCILFRHEP
jgi:hypothetical protein